MQHVIWTLHDLKSVFRRSTDIQLIKYVRPSVFRWDNINCIKPVSVRIRFLNLYLLVFFLNFSCLSIDYITPSAPCTAGQTVVSHAAVGRTLALRPVPVNTSRPRNNRYFATQTCLKYWYFSRQAQTTNSGRYA